MIYVSKEELNVLQTKHCTSCLFSCLCVSNRQQSCTLLYLPLKAARDDLGVRVHGQGHEMQLGQRGRVGLGVRPEVGNDQRTPLGSGWSEEGAKRAKLASHYCWAEMEGTKPIVQEAFQDCIRWDNKEIKGRGKDRNSSNRIQIRVWIQATKNNAPAWMQQ
jgi:hypothetical protein